MIEIFIDNFYDNAGPMDWQFDGVTLTIHPIPDHERFSPNCQTSHWNFKIIVDPKSIGQTIKLHLGDVGNCWNRTPVKAFGSDKLTCAVSRDKGKNWETIRFQDSAIDGIAKELELTLDAPVIQVSKVVPYNDCDLQQLIHELGEKLTVNIIGKTVEGRDLEMISLGTGAHGVFLRGRAHPWETGGSWLIDGLLRRLCDGSEESEELLKHVRFDIMPMAAKDGVYRGMTRFTVNGVDLNRNWYADKDFDPELNPENTALLNWFKEKQQTGKLPDLAICIHNDEDGSLHLSHPKNGFDEYMSKMNKFEDLLRKHTWFAEQSTTPEFHNPGSFGEGLNERFGVDALIWELHASYAKGLGRPPLHTDWQKMGADFATVISHYF